MTFNALSELKNTIVQSIAEVLGEKEITDFKIVLTEFRWENMNDGCYGYQGFDILIADKITDEKIYQVVFNNANGEHITMGKVPFDDETIILNQFDYSKTAFKTAFSNIINKFEESNETNHKRKRK